MTNILTIESCIMKWEGGICPPIPTLLSGILMWLYLYSHQPCLEAIPTKSHVSPVIKSKILISFAVLAKISTCKGGWGNISTPYISNFSYLIIIYIFTIIPLPFDSLNISCVHLI